MAAQGQPMFSGFLKASGQAEIWDDTDKKKFQQFGWRTTTNESAYSNETLIGNWNEERFDVSKLVEPRPLPSQVSETIWCHSTYFCFIHSMITASRLLTNIRTVMSSSTKFPISCSTVKVLLYLLQQSLLLSL